MVEVTEQAVQSRLSKYIRWADEGLLYGSIVVGVATHFFGLVVGVLLYFALFIGLIMKQKVSLHILIAFATVSMTTLLVATQFQYRTITYVLLHFWATIAILFAIRWLADIKAVSYLGVVIARATKIERLGGQATVWVLAGMAAGYGAVQLWYDANSTDWGTLTVIAVSLLLPIQSPKATLFLYSGVGTYAVMTTLLLWKGILIIGSDPLFFVQSYLPDLLLPFLLTFCYSVLSSRNVNKE